ncbi:MAG TPA: arsenate reductase ArsC [Armatimonadota bacterium]|jgi:protein-tyrosine-phosphatase
MQVLFVCVHNAGRSQMAEAWFNALAPAGLQAVSAGTEPGTAINPAAVQAMAEVGIDLTGRQPKLATPEMVAASARIITMGCGVQESCPLYLGMKIDEDWGLDDPAGQPLDMVRRIRDQIRVRVVALIDELQHEEDSEEL